jgi:DNA-directed RNA polymerase subunit RPC12/RpoP
MEAQQQANERQRQEAEQRRQEYEQRQAAERERREREAEEQRQRWEEQQRRNAEQQQRFAEQQQQRHREMQERMASLSTRLSGPTSVTEYYCSNCNKEVSASIPAGGNCPHCGVRFDYVETPDGKRQYASGSSDSGGSTSRFRVTGRAIKGVIFLVVLLCGGVAALWRKVFGE